jgi:hypothetical protein
MDLNAEERTMLSAQVPLRLREELARLARRHDRSISAEVREAVRLHLHVNDAGGPSSLVPPVESLERRAPADPLAEARPLAGQEER